MNDNAPATETQREQRIRERAYRIWEEEGRPHGRDVDIWERARELDAIEQNPPGQLPNPLVTPPRPAIEEAAVQSNLGEFPGLMTDQGDRPQTPVPQEATATQKTPSSRARESTKPRRKK